MSTRPRCAHHLILFAMLSAALVPRIACAQLKIASTASYACPRQREVTLTAMENDTARQVDWQATPEFAGTLSAPNGTATTFRYNVDPQAAILVDGIVTVTARKGGNDTATYALHVGPQCREEYDGDMTRVTIGYEQIGASGLESTQKYAFDFFVTRPVPIPPLKWLEARGLRPYFGSPLKWWGEVRVGSYPQQVSTEAAAFGTGFFTSSGKLPVNKLVQTAEFTSGPELRLLGSANAARSVVSSNLQRLTLTAFFGLGAVGPFPLVSDSLPVFLVPDSTTPQGKAFAQALPKMTTESIQVTSKYVAFRPEVPDRFLINYTVGLRLYTFFASENGQPLQTPPAMVSIAWGRNDLIASSRDGRAWHISAFYPLAFGDRADSTALILYIFGDAWMSGTRPRFSAPGYQLEIAKDSSGKPVPASNKDVTVVPVLDAPRDTSVVP